MLHRKIMELDLTVEQIGERVVAHHRAAIEHEQEQTERLRQMLRAMPPQEES